MNIKKVNVYILKYLNSIYVEGKVNKEKKFSFYNLPQDESSLLSDNIISGKREVILEKVIIKDDLKYEVSYILIELKLELKNLKSNQKLIPIYALNKNKFDFISFPYIEILEKSLGKYSLSEIKMLKDLYELENFDLELYLSTIIKRIKNKDVSTNIENSDDLLRYLLYENKDIKLLYKNLDTLKEYISNLWGE